MAITSGAKLPTCPKCDDFGCYTRQNLSGQIGCNYATKEKEITMKSNPTTQLKGKSLYIAQFLCHKMIEDQRNLRNYMQWISIKDKLPEQKKVLAIHLSKKDTIYNCRADGWFRDTIYSCRTDGKRFIIESHGPELPATHWMPLPQLPNLNEMD